MGVRKKVKKRNPTANAQTTEITMPVIAYSDSGLAKLICAAWENGQFNQGGVNVQRLGDALLERDNRTDLPTQGARNTALAAVNHFTDMSLKSAVVITEDEHDDDFTMQDDDQVVFVLPNKSRATIANPFPNPLPTALLNTAKLLMACTPNGI